MKSTLIAALLIGIAAPAAAQDIPDRPIRRGEIVAAAKRQFALIDANHDGTVTRAEFEAFRASRAGRAAAQTRDPFARIGGHWFDHGDPNGSGRVTEAMAIRHPLTLFDQADLNRDGVLSLEELKLAQAVMALTSH